MLSFDSATATATAASVSRRVRALAWAKRYAARRRAV
ncbi:hypothetical protein M218_21670 [Burkholderia pseudomallei MSHR338]|nr:hypothetical protein M218_21670 [Burkholderia pseudomallei MSHR338]